MKFKPLFVKHKALVRAAACVAKAKSPAFCTVKVKSPLQLLWITKLYSTHWKKNLSLNGETKDVIVRDFQMHPFRREVQHIDFQAVKADQPVRIRVPLHIVNAENSQAVKLQGGRVSLLNTTVEVVALPANIPAYLDLDCTKVVAGDILHLSDIQLPEGVESVSLKRNENLAVATVTGKKR